MVTLRVESISRGTFYGVLLRERWELLLQWLWPLTCCCLQVNCSVLSVRVQSDPLMMSALITPELSPPSLLTPDLSVIPVFINGFEQELRELRPHLFQDCFSLFSTSVVLRVSPASQLNQRKHEGQRGRRAPTFSGKSKWSHSSELRFLSECLFL